MSQSKYPENYTDNISSWKPASSIVIDFGSITGEPDLVMTLDRMRNSESWQTLKPNYFRPTAADFSNISAKEVSDVYK